VPPATKARLWWIVVYQTVSLLVYLLVVEFLASICHKFLERQVLVVEMLPRQLPQEADGIEDKLEMVLVAQEMVVC